MENVKRLDLEICEDSVMEGLPTLVKKIRPKWDPKDLELKVIDGGKVNKMWRMHVKNDPEDKVLVKILSASSGQYFNREREQAILTALSERGIIMPLYCIFTNGYAYKYEPGDVMTTAQTLQPNLYRKIIKTFHELHALNIEEIIGMRTSNLYRDVMNGVQIMFQDSQHDYLDTLEKYKMTFPERKELTRIVDKAMELNVELEQQFPIVFTHADAHCLNLIYNPQEDRITFLDWECCGMNAEVIDIATHWYLDPNYHYLDYGEDICELDDSKRIWLREYLKTHTLYKHKDVTDDLIETWLIGCYKAGYLQSLVRVVWALAQMKLSRIDYDYMRFATDCWRICKRLQEKYSG